MSNTFSRVLLNVYWKKLNKFCGESATRIIYVCTYKREFVRGEEASRMCVKSKSPVGIKLLFTCCFPPHKKCNNSCYLHPMGTHSNFPNHFYSGSNKVRWFFPTRPHVWNRYGFGKYICVFIDSTNNIKKNLATFERRNLSYYVYEYFAEYEFAWPVRQPALLLFSIIEIYFIIDLVWRFGYEQWLNV